MKALGWVLVGIAVLAAVISLDPAVVGLSELAPVLRAIALRGVAAVAAAVLGLALVLAAVLLRRSAGKGRRLLVLGVVVVLVAVGHAGVLLERGTDPGETFGVPPTGAVDVLTLNTHGMAAGVAAIAAMIDELAPDVVALQELAPQDAERVAAALSTEYQVFTDTTGPQPVQGTALLVADALGTYEQIEAPATTFGSVWATPAEGVGPELLAVHTVPPLGLDVSTWRTELEAVTGLCARVENVVIAGDLNATVDHAVLRGSRCLDGAIDIGGVGTWPADRPAVLGAPIDHVLMDPGGWEPVVARVIEPPSGGDHRAMLVRIVPVS